MVRFVDPRKDAKAVLVEKQRTLIVTLLLKDGGLFAKCYLMRENKVSAHCSRMWIDIKKLA